MTLPYRRREQLPRFTPSGTCLGARLRGIKKPAASSRYDATHTKSIRRSAQIKHRGQHEVMLVRLGGEMTPSAFRSSRSIVTPQSLPRRAAGKAPARTRGVQAVIAKGHRRRNAMPELATASERGIGFSARPILMMTRSHACACKTAISSTRSRIYMYSRTAR